MRTMRPPRRERGFLIIAGVFLVVVLAGLAVYLSSVSTTSQAASAADLGSARAYQAARAGIEWGAFQILENSPGAYKTACDAATNPAAPTIFNLTFGGTLAPFTASVRCSSASPTEGATPVTSYRIEVNGCNEPTGGACPNAATTSATYVERELRLTIAR